jgi:cyclase
MMTSRRAFLSSTALAGAALAQKPPASAFEIEKVADGVWATLAKPMAIGNCNGAVFELSDGLLIVDTHARPSAAQAALQAIRQQTKKPIKYVVLTHIHGDHVQGMPAYRKAAPGAQFITHAATRKRMSEGGDPMPGIRAAREKALAEAEQKLAASGADEKAYWQRVVAESKDFLAEMKNVTLTLPEITVSRDWVIHDKLQDIHVLFRGRGHTDGDLMVYSPQRRVIATADLCPSTNPLLSPFVRELPRTLVAFAQECPFDKAIPGHGSVQNGPETLYRLADYVEEMTFTAERWRAPKQLKPSEVKSLSGAYGQYMAEQIWRWRLPLPGVKSAEQALAAAVATNSDQVYNAVK